MTQDDTQTLSELEERAAKACSAERLKLQPQVARVMATLKAKGRSVPARFKVLDRTLREEAMDDMFDNLPV